MACAGWRGARGHRDCRPRGAASYPLERIARDVGFHLHADRVAGVAPADHAVETAGGERLSYDLLVVATGAAPVPPFEHARTFAGTPADEGRLHGLVQDVQGGYAHKVAFVVPDGTTWRCRSTSWR